MNTESPNPDQTQTTASTTDRSAVWTAQLRRPRVLTAAAAAAVLVTAAAGLTLGHGTHHSTAAQPLIPTSTPATPSTTPTTSHTPARSRTTPARHARPTASHPAAHPRTSSARVNMPVASTTAGGQTYRGPVTNTGTGTGGNSGGGPVVARPTASTVVAPPVRTSTPAPPPPPVRTSTPPPPPPFTPHFIYPAKPAAFAGIPQGGAAQSNASACAEYGNCGVTGLQSGGSCSMPAYRGDTAGAVYSGWAMWERSPGDCTWAMAVSSF